MNDDHAYMARALQLARKGLYGTDPNPRVGCVIVRDGQVVGEGWHAAAGGPHAEAGALVRAGARADGATAYVTLAPCNHQGRTPPCTEALLAAGIRRVVAACEDPNPGVRGGGLERLREAGVAVECGVGQAAAETLNRGFFLRARRGRGLLRLKCAFSLDGRSAMASGESQWITGAQARADVQFWRARSSCVLTGAGTVLADDPGLDVRLGASELAGTEVVRQPLRVVLDAGLRTPPGARVLTLPGPSLLVCAPRSAERAGRYPESVAVRSVSEIAPGKLDLAAVLAVLGAEFEANEVQVETGAKLAGALLREGLVDELLCYIAPDLLGSDARPFAELPLQHLAERHRWRSDQLRVLGRDWRVVLSPDPAASDEPIAAGGAGPERVE